MEYNKDLKQMSNMEIKVYQEELTNLYEKIKYQIKNNIKDLDKLDIEYTKTVSELNKRKNIK